MPVFELRISMSVSLALPEKSPKPDGDHTANCLREGDGECIAARIARAGAGKRDRRNRRGCGIDLNAGIDSGEAAEVDIVTRQHPGWLCSPATR